MPVSAIFFENLSVAEYQGMLRIQVVLTMQYLNTKLGISECTTSEMRHFSAERLSARDLILQYSLAMRCL